MLTARPPARGLARAWLAVVLLVAVIIGSASPASAHASLLSVDPPDGARLDESPAAVTLTFSEPVSAELGGVRVVDGDGNQVQVGAARVDGVVVTVDLQPDLPDGTYVVSYRVISADGHPVRGGSVFGVGAGEVDAGALGRVTGDDGDRVWDVVGAFGRAFAYGGSILAAGGALFLVLVHRGGSDRARLVRVVRIAAAVGAVGSLVALPVQAALGTGQGPGSLFDDGVLGQVAADGVGLSVVLSLLGLGLLAVTLERSRPLALLAAVVAAGSFAASGHTRAGDLATVATLADISHLLVVASWAGGVVLLALALRARRGEDAPSEESGAESDGETSGDATGELVVRFSSLATAGVILASVSGSILGWNEVRSLEGLTTTGYGLLLLSKVSAVGGMAGLGAYNHYRLIPALRKGKRRAALRQMRTSLALEVVCLVAVVAITAVLVVVTPARSEMSPGVVEKMVEIGDIGSIQVTVAPAATGANQVHLYTFDADGRPAEIVESLTLDLSLPSAGIGPITREAQRAGPAHLQLDTSDFAVAGDWQIEITARLDRFSQESATVEIPISG
ncbi:MAG TPA: copper resistance protein CopC [Acidimicrobiales bacterium]